MENRLVHTILHTTVACWHVCDIKCNTQGGKQETFTGNGSQEESVAHITNFV